MRAIAIKPFSTWSGDTADAVVLGYDERRRRRIALMGQRGLAFLLDLPATAWLHDGDALVLEDGRLIEVVAAPESLLEIRCVDALHLARMAWHLGNRHLPTQMLPNALRVRRDHVIAEMAEKLGARVVEIEVPFDPEGGAYGTAADHPGHGGHHHHDDHHAHAEEAGNEGG